jgi:prepilin-type N-terminal cleavage/methylation domain-containing protein/prepilin-type processing-associated H-X9-DG protein
MRRSAFTLIELLVVVAIIAALIAMLLPAFDDARAAARTAKCAAQQRGVGAAMFAYTSDNMAVFPWAVKKFMEPAPFSPAPTSPGLPISWDDLLGAYDGRNLTRAMMLERWLRGPLPGNVHDLPGNAQYQCPTGATGTSSYRRDYGINGGAYQQVDPPPGIAFGSRSVSQNAVPAASTTFAVGEAYLAQLGSEHASAAVTSPYNQTGMGVWGYFAPFHGNRDRWNYLFCDGHVELLDPEVTYGTGNRGGPPDDRDGAKGMWTRNPND